MVIFLFYTYSVEIPTVTRVKKWALSFDELLSDETGCTEFEHFLKKEYSHENIRFYKACKELIVAPLSKVASMKNNIERLVNAFSSRKENTLGFANRVNPVEVAHKEPPRLDPHCLPSCLFLNMI